MDVMVERSMGWGGLYVGCRWGMRVIDTGSAGTSVPVFNMCNACVKP